MKKKIVNGRWSLWTTDTVADWDGGTGDYATRQGWEFERFESMQRNLKYGDVFYDIGVEHGWMSAVIGREFVGAENMVLIEPSPEFWINIRKVWQYNGLNEPLGCFDGFICNVTTGEAAAGWPPSAVLDAAECPSMAYRSLGNEEIKSIRIDDYVIETGHIPDALNIDIEGAEYEALLGSHATLAAHKPLVWVSIHTDLIKNFGSSKEELIRMMKSHGYTGTHLGTDHEEHWLFEAT